MRAVPTIRPTGRSARARYIDSRPQIGYSPEPVRRAILEPMKLGSILLDGRETVIVDAGRGRAATLRELYSVAGLAAPPATIQALIDAGKTEWDMARGAAEFLPRIRGKTANANRLDWLPVQPRASKILGVAFNNRALMRTAHKDPGVPNFFLKPPSSLLGHGKPIEVRDYYGATIPECELAAVIGRRGKDIAPSDALDYVFGYTIMNDVTSHEMKFGMDSVAVTRPPEIWSPYMSAWRNSRGEDDRDLYFVYHTRSKGADTYGPCGPWLTTADEVPDPNSLEIRAWVDGEQFAVDNTSSYRFTIQEVIAEASRFFTLEPGDLFSFGTTAKGVGRFPHAHRNVDLSKRAGTIEIEIQGLGRLVNPVIHVATHNGP